MSEKLGPFEHPDLTVKAFKYNMHELIKTNNLQFTKFHDEVDELVDELELHMHELIDTIALTFNDISNKFDDTTYQLNYYLDKRR